MQHRHVVMHGQGSPLPAAAAGRRHLRSPGEPAAPPGAGDTAHPRPVTSADLWCTPQPKILSPCLGAGWPGPSPLHGPCRGESGAGRAAGPTPCGEGEWVLSAPTPAPKRCVKAGDVLHGRDQPPCWTQLCHQPPHRQGNALMGSFLHQMCWGPVAAGKNGPSLCLRHRTSEWLDSSASTKWSGK